MDVVVYTVANLQQSSVSELVVPEFLSSPSATRIQWWKTSEEAAAKAAEMNAMAGVKLWVVVPQLLSAITPPKEVA